MQLQLPAAEVRPGDLVTATPGADGLLTVDRRPALNLATCGGRDEHGHGDR